MVVGPDAYKDLPNLIQEVDEGRNAVNVILSKEETYGDISPVRLQYQWGYRLCIHYPWL